MTCKKRLLLCTRLLVSWLFENKIKEDNEESGMNVYTIHQLLGEWLNMNMDGWMQATIYNFYPSYI